VIGRLSPLVAVAFLAVVGSSPAATIYIADPVADAVYAVDSSAVGAAPTLLSCTSDPLTGTGPGFEGICAIGLSPAGLLFVMDGLGDRLRILRVDKSTGERTLQFEIPNGGWDSQFWMRQEGKFLMIRTGRDPVAPNTKRMVELAEVTPAGGGTVNVTTLAKGFMPGLPFDGALVSGRLSLLYPQVYGP